MRIRAVVAWLLFMTGALLLMKGSLSVFPFLFPSEHPLNQSIVFADRHHQPTLVPEGSALFELLLPRLSSNFTVLEGTSEQTLRRGPGHLGGSALPDESGNVVIAGHRDTHFRLLKDVVIGDTIQIRMDGAELFYRVVNIRVVKPQ